MSIESRTAYDPFLPHTFQVVIHIRLPHGRYIRSLLKVSLFVAKHIPTIYKETFQQIYLCFILHLHFKHS